MKYKLLFATLILFQAISIIAQPILTQTFKFQSGVFLSYEEFQSNQPSYSGDEIKAAYFHNPQTEEIKVEYIRIEAEDTYLKLDSIWGISIKGIPYVQVPINKPTKGLQTFAKMEVRGNICYYFYNDIEKKKIPFSAYNPFTQRPYRTAVLEREIPVVKEKILRFETGVVTDFTYDNVLEWIQDEPELVQALKSLGAQQAEKGLFKTLLLYDDRHEVRLKN